MLEVVFNIVMEVLLQGMSTISLGILLGIGFWIAKQITNWLDEKRVLADRDFMNELKEQVA